MNNNFDGVFQLVRCNEYDNVKKIVNETNINQFINEYEQNLLHEAIAYNSSEILTYLLYCNININKQDNEGKSPLHYCVEHNNYGFTKLLLSLTGIQKDIIDDYGNNAMWVAVFNSHGFYDIVKLLKECGVNQNSKNNSNRSALDFAKQIESKELVEILLG